MIISPISFTLTIRTSVLAIVLLILQHLEFASATPRCPEMHLKLLTSDGDNQKTGLFVCGIEDKNEKAPDGIHRVTAFQIFNLESNDLILKNDSEIKHFEISLDSKNGVQIEELIWNNKYYPFTKRTVTCKNKKCNVSKLICSLNIPKNPFPGIVDSVKKKAQSERRNEEPFYDALIANAWIQALSGDPEAKSLFEVKDWAFLNLDGSSAEVYLAGRKQLDQAKKAGCFSVKREQNQIQSMVIKNPVVSNTSSSLAMSVKEAALNLKIVSLNDSKLSKYLKDANEEKLEPLPSASKSINDQDTSGHFHRCEKYRSLPHLIKGCQGEACGILRYNKAVRSTQVFSEPSDHSKKIDRIQRCEWIEDFEPS